MGVVGRLDSGLGIFCKDWNIQRISVFVLDSVNMVSSCSCSCYEDFDISCQHHAVVPVVR